MKVMVLGAAGSIGRALASVLRDGGDDTTALSRTDLDVVDRAAIDRAIAATAPDVVVNAAAVATIEAPWVNPRDPALALGPDGRPAVSRRAPIWEDVPDEKWNDWRWQLSNRVNTLEEVGRVLNLTEEEREGLSATDKFRVDITPYFISLIDPDDPTDPIRRQVIPIGREREAFTAMMRDGLYEAYHWNVRHFKEGETNEILIRFDPAGRPYGFRERMPEDEPGAALDSEAALAKRARSIASAC